jgi:aerobic carbon-monoxide dehydrogenase large subunit
MTTHVDVSEETTSYIGRTMPNVDGRSIVTGAAKYTGDIVLAGLLYGRLVHSTVAHGRIVAVDASAALEVEGVVGVLGPDDFRDLPLVSAGPLYDMPLVASDKVRYSGEPVAAVIASSQDAADLAASLVEVEYEQLPLVLDPEEAMKDGAPLVHETAGDPVPNVCWRQDTKVGDIEAAFRDADLVLHQRFVTSKQQAMPMETHAALASWNDPDRTLTIWSSTQNPHVVRDAIARVFSIPASSVRVIKPFVGGGFGHKVGIKTHEAVAVLASMRFRRPVRIALSRWEDLAATVSRNPQVRDVSVALRADGTVLGWRDKIVQDVGAYSGLAPSVLSLSEWVTVGPYRTPALDIEGVCVYTNKPPSSGFRGFGNPQATFARELMFDIAARELDIDPVEFRRRNLIRSTDLPTQTANGLELKTLPIEESLRVALEAIGYDELKRTKKPNQGLGVVTMLEWGGGCRWWDGFDTDMSSVTLTVNADGSALVTSDAADSGQGQATLFTQITSDVLGVRPEDVRVILGDTAAAPYGLGTYASRTSVIQGTALQEACQQLREKLLAVAAHRLETRVSDLDISGGRISVRGTALGMDVAEAAALVHYSRGSLPEGMDTSALTVTASHDTACVVPDKNGFGNFAANYTCSATVAFVEVDPASGKVSVLDWASAEDVGRVLHPDLLEGQIQGGIAQGIGYALGEGLFFDSAGTLLNGSIADYQVPTAPMIPPFDHRKLVAIESHDPTYPMGQKGIGESGMTPAAAAVACAVLDAVGVAITTLPLSPDKIHAAMTAARETT